MLPAKHSAAKHNEYIAIEYFYEEGTSLPHPLSSADKHFNAPFCIIYRV